MNSLSWLLYLADVIGKVGPLLVTAGIVVILAAVILVCIGGLQRDFARSREDEKWREGRALQAVAWKPAIIGLILLTLAAFVPSRNTIMLIAASEVGETVLSSKEAQEIGGEAGQLAADSLRLLRKYVNEQLEGPKEE